MSWLGRVFSNPVKSLTDVGTLGGTFALRETKIAPKLANNITRVYATTAAGVAAGLVTGGIPGAFTGGAAGFGRGVKAASGGEDIDFKLLGEGAKYGAIVGGATGAIRGTGAAGFIRNKIFTGASKVPALPKVRIPSATGFLTAATTAFAALRPQLGGTFGTTIAPPSAPNMTLETPTAGTYDSGPANTPSAAPVVVESASAQDNTPWLILAAILAVVVVVVKKHHR